MKPGSRHAGLNWTLFSPSCPLLSKPDIEPTSPNDESGPEADIDRFLSELGRIPVSLRVRV